MNAVEIIRRKVSNEGFDIPLSRLRVEAAGRVLRGQDWIFQYDNVVFTISKDKHEAHLYSEGGNLFSAMRRFMFDAWQVIDSDFMIAPVLNPTIQKLVERFKWLPIGRLPWGHRVYIARRQA